MVGKPVSQIITIAAGNAVQQQKTWAVDKDFNSTRAAEIAATPALQGRIVLLLLRRNFWHRVASLTKIEDKCSTYRFTNSARCKASLRVRSICDDPLQFEAAVFDLEMMRRAENGIAPFSPSTPVVAVDYDETTARPLGEVSASQNGQTQS